MPAGCLERHVKRKKSAFFGLPGLLLINFQRDVSATCLFLETQERRIENISYVEMKGTI